MKLNKKHITKRLLCVLLTFFMFGLLPKAHAVEDSANETAQSEISESNGNEENEFNFIKSNKCDGGLFYNDNWLLYGGIILIITSVTGIVLTLKRKKPRNLRKNKKSK